MKIRTDSLLALGALGVLAWRWWSTRDAVADGEAQAGIDLVGTLQAEPRPATPDDLVSVGVKAVINVPFPSEAQARYTVERLFPGGADRFSYAQDAVGLWHVTAR
jgi:hypothetical protein